MGREWEEGRTEVVREDGENDAEQASDEDVRRVMAVVCVSDLLAMLLRAEDAANAPIVREMAISVAPMIGARASHALICARESVIRKRPCEKKERTLYPRRSNRCILPARYKDRYPNPEIGRASCRERVS